ncbi:MAG: multicopper oxidase domain-containing protein [Gammaproteobacteria bacterium]|nr:multicopper oxidase domain-containing protein [Gammaproteobacteria bacterium]
MKNYTKIAAKLAAAPLLLALGSPAAFAGIPGVTDKAGSPADGSAEFELWARSGTIVLGDGNSLAAWGYSTSSAGGMQYPGPTLIVREGDAVTVTLHNALLLPTSAIFPGQTGVTAAPCATGASTPGVMTLEAPGATALNGNDGGCVQYSFTAARPGTYMYQTGTRPELQVEMGLVGALLVRPAGFVEGTHESHPDRTAYGTPSGGPGAVAGYQPTHYDREYLFLLTEMDRSAHEAVDARQQAMGRRAVTVNNASFEAPDCTVSGGACINDAVRGNYTAGTAAGWTAATSAGVFRPIGVITPTQGAQVGYSNGGMLSQVLSESVAANTVYTLSVDVGDRSDIGFPGYTVGLYAGGTLLAENVGMASSVTSGWATSTLTYATGATPPAGALEIRLKSAGGQTDFDNVRLTRQSTNFDDPALDAVPGARIDASAFKATLWFMNGRNAPDTMLERNVDWLPSQPYNALARAHAGERVLMRIIGAGRDLHPFHHHGNNAWMVARDGQVLGSGANAAAGYPDYKCIPEFDPAYVAHVADGSCQNFGATPKSSPGLATLPDQAVSNYTIQVVPGSTYDAIYTWTGRSLNWDIYGSSPGHQASLPPAPVSLPINDSSFEGTSAADGQAVTAILGWIESAPADSWTFDPSSSFTPVPTAGEQIAWSRRGAALSKVLPGIILQAGTNYTLSVDVGKGRSGTTNQVFAGYRVQLLAGTTVLAESLSPPAAAPANGTFQTVTLNYTAPASPPAGELSIVLASTDASSASSSNRTYFDNVRLSSLLPAVDCNESTRLPGEDPMSHCHLFQDPMGARNFPVTLPEQQSLTFGGHWSGSAYLGSDEPIPPLQGGLNPGSGYSFMWHSHTERELTNDDVFPGGMMTMFILEKEPDAGDNICEDGAFNTDISSCAP